MKRVPKKQIDKPKRIQHLKNEKFILKFLKQIQADILKGIYTHTIVQDEQDNGESGTQDTSQRGSYIIDDTEGTPLPLNFIVNLHETFAD